MHKLHAPPEDDESLETLAPFDEAFTDSEQLTAAAFASNAMKIAFGENAGKNVRRIGKTFGFLGEHALIKSTRCAVVNGFSLRANRYVGEKERSKLKKIFSYAARPSFSNKRLTLKDQSIDEYSELQNSSPGRVPGLCGLHQLHEHAEQVFSTLLGLRSTHRHCELGPTIFAF